MGGGWLPAAPSQMAAGTAPRLADNQRTSKLSRLALGPIASRSQEARGTEARRKEASVEEDRAVKGVNRHGNEQLKPSPCPPLASCAERALIFHFSSSDSISRCIFLFLCTLYDSHCSI
ncbi:hypothetical protein EYF80_067997 [Liparis tanakae]|uniref:Uncharacterized protein n=1 Tax=Liparis tanakae TaxID=230148 RepID=A0A4Z2DZA3_9TELE|nr:hypothetical protein EYF80_067997 [Liparis tanakae]